MDDQIREKWRGLVTTDETWTIDEKSGLPLRGEAKGIWVRSATSIAGYLKPTKVDGKERYRPAYEKIASDLAYEVGVNVPPAVLYVRPDVTAEKPSPVVI